MFVVKSPKYRKFVIGGFLDNGKISISIVKLKELKDLHFKIGVLLQEEELQNE